MTHVGFEVLMYITAMNFFPLKNLVPISTFLSLFFNRKCFLQGWTMLCWWKILTNKKHILRLYMISYFNESSTWRNESTKFLMWHLFDYRGLLQFFFQKASCFHPKMSRAEIQNCSCQSPCLYDSDLSLSLFYFYSWVLRDCPGMWSEYPHTHLITLHLAWQL